MKPIYSFALWTIAGLAILLSGCTDWDTDNGSDGSATALKLTLNVPGTSAAGTGTRALTAANECELRTVDVLLFRVAEDGSEVFFDRIAGELNTAEAGQKQRSCTVKLPEQYKDDSYRLVLLANLNAEFYQAAGMGEDVSYKNFQGKTKSEVFDLILFSAGKWATDATSESKWTPLPMWGESREVHKLNSDLTSAAVGEINLMRAVARVDVGLAMAADGTPQGIAAFRMTDLYVYNMPGTGRCAPLADATHYNPAGGAESKGRALLPSVPAGSGIVSNEINHYTAVDVAAGTTGFVREVYLAEADNKGKAAAAANELCCLVVGGYYKNAARPAYYRIDFTQERQTGAPSDPDGGVLKNRLDILRNHRYRVNITSVNGPGYSTPEEAFNSVPVDLRSEITVWDEGSLDDAVLDGRYTLDVNTNQINLYVDGFSRELAIDTNHPDGWSIEADGAALPDWLKRVTLDADGKEQKTDLANGWTSAQNGGNELRIGASTALWLREGDFYVRAGNLRKKIHVKQTLERGLVLEVSPARVWFAASARRSLPVKVTTTPAGQLVHFAVTSTDAQLNNPDNWTYTDGKNTVSGFPASGNPNRGTYYFRPPVNETGRVRHAQITVYIKDTEGGTDEVYSQALTISQMPDDFIAWDPEQPLAGHAGGELSFNVTYARTQWSVPQFYTADFPNVSWAKLMGTDAAGMGMNDPFAAGTPVACRLKLAANTEGERTLQLLVHSADLHYPDELVTIVQQSPATAPDDIYFEDTDYKAAADGTLAWTNGMALSTMKVVVEARTVKQFKVWMEVVNPSNTAEVWNKGEEFTSELFRPTTGGKETITLKKPYNPKFGMEGLLRIRADWGGRKEDDVDVFQRVNMERHPVTNTLSPNVTFIATYATIDILKDATAATLACQKLTLAGLPVSFPNTYNYAGGTNAAAPSYTPSYTLPYKCGGTNSPSNGAGITVHMKDGWYNTSITNNFESNRWFNGNDTSSSSLLPHTGHPLCVRAPRTK